MKPIQPDFSRKGGSREAPLAGWVVAITGAASGIGRAVALECRARGAHVALADIDGEAIARLSVELEQTTVPGALVLARRVDVRDRPALQAFAEEVEAALGPTSAIVNAAGVSLHCPLDETTPEDFDWVMATNFWGAVHGTQAFLPRLQERGRGHVINVSSAFGLAGFPASGAYVASKFALRGFTETLSIELSLTHPSIRVTTVHPGGVDTPLVQSGRVRGHGPLSRTPDEVVTAFERHLARTSPEACARDIVRLLLRPRSRLLVGADARVIDWAVRLFPSFYQRLVAHLARPSARGK